MKFLSLLIISFASIVATAQEKTIVYSAEPKGWIIQTKSSTYQIVVDKNEYVKTGFYGAVEQAEFGKKNAQWTESIDEVPVRGGTPFKMPALEVVFADHVRDADLKFVSGSIIDVDGRKTLKITQQDRVYPLQIISYIRALPEYDILEKWIEVKNTGATGAIKIENLKSGSFVLPADEYVMTQLSGKQMNEFQPFESLLVPGLRTIENKAFKSNFNAPWFQVRPQRSANDVHGPTWFGVLHYSGNWGLEFNKTFNSTVQILGGINFWDTELNLQPGQHFTTPKMTIGYTEGGNDGVSLSLQSYVRKEILPKNFREKLRPILFNSWYATTYFMDEEQQVAMAKTAAEAGMEYFVIDDGWYKDRTTHLKGLGDWEADKIKFPNGLSSMITRINKLGMKFGIWLEPESVNPNSDIYRKHPDWILSYPGRKKELPYRVFLNLAKPEVYDHLLTTITKLLKENNIEFVKWDQNTYLTEPGWMDAPVEMQREVRIRYTENLYKLVDELRERFPNVWFENCASGAGRVDYGMMSKMDQAWASDDATALNRLFIQYGYLNFLPANTMVSWVIDEIANTWQQPTTLAYKFDVAMAGVLGIGSDIRKWTTEDKAIATEKIALYKKIRPIVQQGMNYRLVSPHNSNRMALQYITLNQSSGVIMCYNMAKYIPSGQDMDRITSVLKLKGLNPDKKYALTNMGNKKEKPNTYSGAFLMKIGIAWPVSESFTSTILMLEEAK